MPIISAILLPNSPLLLPGLKDSIRQSVKKTVTAANNLGLEISQLKPEVIFVIASLNSNTQLNKSGWAFLQNPTVKLFYPNLGDFISQTEVKVAVGLTHKLKEALEANFPIPLISQADLPYTAGVPLWLIGQNMKELSVVYLQVPEQINLESLSLVSQALHEQLQSSSLRVAVVAAGELGRVETNNQTEAKLFNQQFLNFCQIDDWDSIFNLPAELLSASGQTIWTPAVILKSLLSKKSTLLQSRSFEAPFEAGWLVAELSY